MWLPHRVVFQGCSSSSECTTANVVWAMTFCPDSTMQLCVGTHGSASTGKAGAGSGGSSWVQAYTLTANTLYTFTAFGSAPAASEGFLGEWAHVRIVLHAISAAITLLLLLWWRRLRRAYQQLSHRSYLACLCAHSYRWWSLKAYCTSWYVQLHHFDVTCCRPCF